MDDFLVQGSKSILFSCAGFKLLGFNALITIDSVFGVGIEIDLVFV